MAATVLFTFDEIEAIDLIEQSLSISSEKNTLKLLPNIRNSLLKIQMQM